MKHPEHHAERVSAGIKRKWQDPLYRERQIEARKRRWNNPEYRARMELVLRANSPIARAKGRATLLAKNLPQPKTPKGRLYRKLREILGYRAARQELGISL
jgi:hypothetical protein